MKNLFFAGILLSLTFTSGFCQNKVTPAVLDQALSNFTLPAYQGTNVQISALKGKNVMLVFPRGKVAADKWCQLCQYQYADMVDFEKQQNLQATFNLEIIFVLPYDKATVNQWISGFGKSMVVLDNYRNPADTSNMSGGKRWWMNYCREHYPKRFDSFREKLPTPFPILIDEGHVVSDGLRLFQTKWDGQEAEQNIPAIIILDSNGLVKFKYLSQNTLDRPTVPYLMKILKAVL